MSEGLKQCPNGHYFMGDQCPYCTSSSSSFGNTSITEPYDFSGDDQYSQPSTEATDDYDNSSETKTTFAEGETVIGGPGAHYNPNSGTAPMSGKTEFVDENGNYRVARKIVGWLVTYTLEPMGVSFTLYEGKNYIGRGLDCHVTVNDNLMSRKHAVILFRSGKYSITDEHSDHGTFVNDEDIDLNPKDLKDGDIIRMGKTVFKFRSSF